MQPKLQRHVGGAELHRRQADMVMPVHEPGQHHLAPGADDRRAGMRLAQRRVGADGLDHAVLLQHGAVIDLVPAVAAGRVGDHEPAADQGGGQRCLQLRLGGGLGDGFLLGEGAVHLVAQQLGEFTAEALRIGRERVARTGQVHRHDGLDAAGPGGLAGVCRHARGAIRSRWPRRRPARWVARARSGSPREKW